MLSRSSLLQYFNFCQSLVKSFLYDDLLLQSLVTLNAGDQKVACEAIHLKFKNNPSKMADPWCEIKIVFLSTLLSKSLFFIGDTVSDIII